LWAMAMISVLIDNGQAKNESDPSFDLVRQFNVAVRPETLSTNQ